MDEVKATETIVPPIAAEETVVASPEDAEARYAQLEVEKENYRKAYLKEAERSKHQREDSEKEEDTEEKMKRIARETLAESQIATMTREQSELIPKILKENRELKLARLNKTEPPAAVGTHSESTPVRDTMVTPDQMAFFKSKGWSDKDIERYKKNLSKRM